MKNCRLVGIAVLMLSCATLAQNQSGSVPRTDVYHVHVAQAAPGKVAQLGDYLKAPDPNSPMPGHLLVLRHQDGSEWDYVMITHLGTKATVNAAGNPPPSNVRDLYAWHTDTFVNGPAWPDFVKSLGLGDNAAKTANSVYVVSFYRALAGRREELEKSLAATAPGGSEAGTVLLQHLEGGPWTFMTVTRFDSWQKFGENESSSVAQTNKGSGPWFDLRQNVSTHNDTVTSRIAP